VPPDGLWARGVFRALAASPAWAGGLAAVSKGSGPHGASPVRPVEAYVDALATLGLVVDAWETTYLHVLPGPDPVLEWFAGTGLRPYLDALAGDADAVARFRAEVAEGLRAVYPPRPYGTVLPFRRTFVVGGRA